ncbi:DUF4436 family protein [Streptomyces sp. H34-S4]|uniref:DUF4436 family protein n=1 Tax=Streptomyces sp. H34-S4 TaxID=2996463 RepID=UPI002D1E4202|nr:DUF4436 family protein [Streptomyces sp. H34-S4]
MTGGSITDYPFDGYEAAVEFAAVLGQEKVPVRVLFSNNRARRRSAVSSTTSPSSGRRS